MNGLELRKPRDVGRLFGDALSVYGRYLGLFVLLSAAVVIPADLIVQGLGLEMLTSSYDESPDVAETVVPAIVEFLVVMPIVAAICIYALHQIAAGQRPPAGHVFVSGFEAFTPLFGAVVLAAVGIAIGFVLLIVPGIYLAIRWYFVPQAVVIEGARGAGALSRSSQIVQGHWWRTFGLVVLANIAIVIPGLIIVLPFSAIAESTDRAIWQLVGSTIATSVTTPFVALFSTLLYYDLRVRREGSVAGPVSF